MKSYKPQSSAAGSPRRSSFAPRLCSLLFFSFLFFFGFFWVWGGGAGHWNVSTFTNFQDWGAGQVRPLKSAWSISSLLLLNMHICTCISKKEILQTFVPITPSVRVLCATGELLLEESGARGRHFISHLFGAVEGLKPRGAEGSLADQFGSSLSAHLSHHGRATRAAEAGAGSGRLAAREGTSKRKPSVL